VEEWAEHIAVVTFAKGIEGVPALSFWRFWLLSIFGFFFLIPMILHAFFWWWRATLLFSLLGSS